jgi:predicted nucleotidyltransferase
VKGTNAMIPLITDNLDQIAELCREYRVQSLAVFGSAATATANEDANDVDLICDLGEYEARVYRRFFDFADAMEGLLGKKVDLMTEEQIQNPYFRYSVNQSRTTIYEARDRHAAA